MKKLLALFSVLTCLVATAEAANTNFENALGDAQPIAQAIEGVTPGDWDAFIAYLHSTGQYATLVREKGRRDFFKDKLVTLFDTWHANRRIAKATDAFDEEDREAFDPEKYLGDAGFGSPARGGGSSVGTSTTALSHAVFRSPGQGTVRTRFCIDEIQALKKALDLSDADTRSSTADRFDKAAEGDREAALKDFLSQDDLRASYIKVLLSDTTHRAEVIRAIVEGPGYDDFRTALIQELLRNEGTRNIIVNLLHTAHHTQLVNKIHEGENRAEMIAKLNGDATSRTEVITDLLTNHLVALIQAIIGDAAHHEAIATALVGNADFRAVLIRLLGEGHSGALIDALRGTQLGAMITSILDNHRADLVARIPTNNDFRNDVIARLIDDVPNHNDIARLFVANDAFRAVLIGLLEAGRYAINITRMLWHEIDRADGVAFLADVTARIVTKAAFDHLLAKTREGYQAISHVTGQRGNFRGAFATDNQVGKTGRDLGSDKPI